MTPANDEEKNPLEQALDLLVYAPLGFALSAREFLPQLAEQGRQRVQAQTAMARVIGQFAVQHGRTELERRLQAYVEGDKPSPRASTTVATSTVAPPAEPIADPDPAPIPAPPVNGSIDDGHLAIPDYDALSASHVVQRLAGLSVDELEAVRSYEGSTRGRKTILSKIDQLQQAGDQPAS